MSYELHTQAIQSLFEGKATVTVKESYKDPVTKVTKTRENVIYTDLPCRLSYGPSSTKEGLGDQAGISVTLFTAYDVVIPRGSTITVTQAGTTEVFNRSGIPKVYRSHREYPLQAVEEWS